MGFIPTQGPFRINAQSPSIMPAAADAAVPPADEYLQRLIKLIPSEVIAIYLTFKEIAASWLGIWTAICLALVVFVRTVGTHKTGRPIQFVAILVAAVSFVLWVYASGGCLLALQLPQHTPGIISVAVGLWTFLVPYFYKGD